MRESEKKRERERERERERVGVVPKGGRRGGWGGVVRDGGACTRSVRQCGGDSEGGGYCTERASVQMARRSP